MTILFGLKEMLVKYGSTEFVLWCIDHNFGGIENLSLIPGNVGATPVQNIGAYGVVKLKTPLIQEAMEIATQQMRTFHKGTANLVTEKASSKASLK